MQAVTTGPYPGQSEITFLPMIDIEPSNMSCVYSTLHFAVSLAARYKVTPVITFDQPLWWKAQLVLNSAAELHPMILRLGGFHTEMSFLGSIGHLMAGSGLQEALEIVFAPNAVTHMLTGKSVERAIRGHFLIDTVLNAILQSIAFNVPLQTSTGDNQEVPEGGSDSLQDTPAHEHDSVTATQNVEPEIGLSDIDDSLKDVLEMFDQLLKGEISAETAAVSNHLLEVEHKLKSTKEVLQRCRTACLWLQYMNMIDILRTFIKAERTGNWFLHLQSLQEMLPYLAASGHFPYTKSVYIYLQQMQTLPRDHPTVFRQFINGYPAPV